jgi:hypothetical protein
MDENPARADGPRQSSGMVSARSSFDRVENVQSNHRCVLRYEFELS